MPQKMIKSKKPSGETSRQYPGDDGEPMVKWEFLDKTHRKRLGLSQDDYDNIWKVGTQPASRINLVRLTMPSFSKSCWTFDSNILRKKHHIPT